MDGPTISSLPRFNTIGHKEKANAMLSLKRPLSGYLGGATPRGGYWTDRLESEWTAAFDCKYAIPCNSATSGLLAAAMAAGIDHTSTVWTTPYSMSATAACAMVLGARVEFIDIEPLRFSLNPNMLPNKKPPKAIIVTNLFGHPAYLTTLRLWCDTRNVILIEDNAQSIFAKEGDLYAGTIGHMGVFSLNVHKHLQVGEGGIICTDDSLMSSRLRGAINHGELGNTINGLNLRMTEPTAAMACAQLSRGEEIIKGRRRLAHAITEMMNGIRWLIPPSADFGCKHSYYVWAGRIDAKPYLRRKFCHELTLRGFPLREGYVKPLNHLFKSSDLCPETDRIEASIVTFEVCAYDPKAHHLRRMKEIVEYVAENIENKTAFAAA